MISKIHKFCVLGSICLVVILAGHSHAAVQQPVLKWKNGGCSSGCDTGWYASPAVADLDGDGKMEVINAAYGLYVVNGEDGSLQDSVNPPGDRVWPGVAVVDLDNNGDLEIVTAHNGGYLNVYDHQLNPVWSKQPTDRELRGLSIYDLDGDGTYEIIVTAALYTEVNTWVYEHTGSLRTGWPQLGDGSDYAHGVFNDNAAVGDIDGDGAGEIIVPSDVHYICAYEANGAQIQASPIYGNKKWTTVGVWEDLAVELRGWGQCNGVRTESFRTNFADGPAVIADVDGDGVNEVVVTGNTYDCSKSPYLSKYVGVFIFNADRSRFKTSHYNWESVPKDTGGPIAEDYTVIESYQSNPVVADLDGDGKKEIIYSSYDGRVHAFWLDKTEHHNWPYSVYQASEAVYRFASEPAVADLDNDGYAEVIFGSWTQKGKNKAGKLHILNYQGTVLREIALPLSGNWDGAMAGPTLADIDGDSDLEVVLNTAHSGAVAYDLPGTAGARVLWGTGRGSYLRNGSEPASEEEPCNGTADLGDVVTALRILAGAAVTDICEETDADGDGRIEIEDVIFLLQDLSEFR